MIYWFVYFETTIDALPMPESLAREIKPLNYYWEKVTNLNYYVLQKAVSVLIYLSFLSYVESKEKTKFNELQYQLPSENRIRYEKLFENIFPTVFKKKKKNIVRSFTDRLNKDPNGFIKTAEKNYKIKI